MKKKLTFFDIINNDDMETNKNENHEIEKVQSFLNQIKTINDSYERVKAITGENYNIFKLLGVESSELLHSKIIGDFLNPKGSHEQGSIFLELFMQTLVGNEAENIEEVDNKEEDIINLKEFLTKFSCSKSSLKLEKSIGKIKNTEETNEGGRIDIFLRDENNKVLIIENKIYAGEQNKQLERYNQFGSEKATDFLIIYLTLNGDKPTSINNENSSKLLCISYKEHIINWLDLCKKEVVNLPIIRESISQYINLLKKLTNQTENQNQAMEIQNLILKNYETSKLVSQNFEKAIYNLSNKIMLNLKLKIENFIEEKNWKIIHYDEKISDNKVSGGISVVPLEFEDSEIRIKIQGFNPFYRHTRENDIFQKNIFIGVLGRDGNKSYINKLKSEGVLNDNFEWWNDYEFIGNYKEEVECRLDNPLLLSELTNEKEIEKFVEFIFGKYEVYFERNYKKVEQVLKENN